MDDGDAESEAARSGGVADVAKTRDLLVGELGPVVGDAESGVGAVCRERHLDVGVGLVLHGGGRVLHDVEHGELNLKAVGLNGEARFEVERAGDAVRRVAAPAGDGSLDEVR